MKLAVTYDNGEIFQHFGHTEAFKVYEIVDGKVLNAQVIGTNGQGHGALAGVLAAEDIAALICGGIGGGAINALNSAGIRVFAGVSGDADTAVQEFLAGRLKYVTEANCSHHGEGHQCSH